MPDADVTFQRPLTSHAFVFTTGGEDSKTIKIKHDGSVEFEGTMDEAAQTFWRTVAKAWPHEVRRLLDVAQAAEGASS